MVRERIPVELSIQPTDREILEAIMIPSAASVRRNLSSTVVLLEAGDEGHALERAPRQLEDLPCSLAVVDVVLKAVGMLLALIGLASVQGLIATKLVDKILVSNPNWLTMTIIIARGIPRTGGLSIDVYDDLFKLIVDFLTNVTLNGIMNVTRHAQQSEEKSRGAHLVHYYLDVVVAFQCRWMNDSWFQLGIIN